MGTEGLLNSEVPGAVVRSFSMQGSSFNRIHDAGARAYSYRLYDKLMGRPERVASPKPEEVLCSLLDPFDVEDLVFVYLQVVRGLLVLPGSRRTDTAAYEYVLVDREGKEQTIVQVKTGDSAVDLEQLRSAAGETHRAIAYSTSGAYAGSAPEVEKLTNKQLLEFMATHPKILPPRARAWLGR